MEREVKRKAFWQESRLTHTRLWRAPQPSKNFLVDADRLGDCACAFRNRTWLIDGAGPIGKPAATFPNHARARFCSGAGNGTADERFSISRLSTSAARPNGAAEPSRERYPYLAVLQVYVTMDEEHEDDVVLGQATLMRRLAEGVFSDAARQSGEYGQDAHIDWVHAVFGRRRFGWRRSMLS
jgi:hypothetical protein